MEIKALSRPFRISALFFVSFWLKTGMYPLNKFLGSFGFVRKEKYGSY